MLKIHTCHRALLATIVLSCTWGGANQAIAATDAPAAFPAIESSTSANEATFSNEPVSRVYGEEKLVGVVRQVAGNQVTLQLDNGTERSVTLPDDGPIGDMSFLVGQRIVLTDTNCTPPPVPTAIEPPHTPSQVVIPQRW